MSIFDNIELRWFLEHPNQPDTKRLQFRRGGERWGIWYDVPLVIGNPEEAQPETQE